MSIFFIGRLGGFFCGRIISGDAARAIAVLPILIAARATTA
jgi:hypothetical protein